MVTWIGDDAASVAFAWPVLFGKGVQQGTLGDVSIVAMYDYDWDMTRVFDSRIDDEVFTFTYDFDTKTVRDDQTGSTWNAEGLAVSGAMRGTQLSRLITSDAYWFNFVALHPNGNAVDVAKVEGEAEDTSNEVKIDVEL